MNSVINIFRRSLGYLCLNQGSGLSSTVKEKWFDNRMLLCFNGVMIDFFFFL